MQSTPTTSHSSSHNLSAIVAKRSHLSRRKAGDAIKAGRVELNDNIAQIGDRFSKGDSLKLDGAALIPQDFVYIMLNKPVDYECSRTPQGGNTSVYELLSPEHQNLHHVGRLDTDSSGLLLFTNDGQLSYELTHPKFEKEKTYQIELDKPLSIQDAKIINKGIELKDGISHMHIKGSGKNWSVSMSEGKNRQIRRTFSRLDYEVAKLHRTTFGKYNLENLRSGKIKILA